MTLARQAMGANDIVPVFNNSTDTAIAAHVAVKLSSTEDAVVLPTLADALLGVTLSAIAPKTWGAVQVHGRAKVLAGGALATPGTQLRAKTDGKAEAWTATAGDNGHLLGTQLTTAADEDDIIEVLLAGPGATKQADD